MNYTNYPDFDDAPPDQFFGGANFPHQEELELVGNIDTNICSMDLQYNLDSIVQKHGINKFVSAETRPDGDGLGVNKTITS